MHQTSPDALKYHARAAAGLVAKLYSPSADNDPTKQFRNAMAEGKRSRPWERGHPARNLGARPSWPLCRRDACAPGGA